MICDIFGVLSVASKADERVASELIENFEQIQSILLSLLSPLNADTIHFPLRFWDSLEKSVRDAFYLVQSLLSSIDSIELTESLLARSIKLKYRAHALTPTITKILRLMSPAFLHALKLRQKHPVLYIHVLTIFSNFSYPYCWMVSTKDIEAIFFTNEHIEEYISIFKETENLEAYTKKTGHCIAKFCEGNDPFQDVNVQLQSKWMILEILGNLSGRSFKKSEGQEILANWFVSVFIEKNLLKVILESSSDHDKYIIRLIQVLSRDKSCRNCLYDNKGKEMIIQLVKSNNNPKIVSETFLLINRLCWDKQWRDYLESIEPKIEKFVAKWLCSVANSIEKIAQTKVDVLEIVRVIPFQRSWRQSELPKTIITQEEQIVNSAQYYTIYPDLRISKMKAEGIELLLTRIILFCSNVHRLRFSNELVSRFTSISFLELLTIFYDWPGDCSIYIKNVIHPYLRCGDFKPQFFSDPTLFVERLCQNFDYEMEISIFNIRADDEKK